MACYNRHHQRERAPFGKGADDAVQSGQAVHSAGSGKSNSIAWLARRLASLYTAKDEFERFPNAKIVSLTAAPQEISFTYRGDARRHTLEEILQLRDEEWFSRGVAPAPECNRSIVDASIQWLQHLRETDTFHQLITVGCSVDHARQVRSLCAERGLQAREIHSNTLRRQTIWAFR